MDDPFFLQDHGAVVDPFHDFQGLQGLQGLQREEEEEEEEMASSAAAVGAAAVGRPASAAVGLDRFIEEGSYPLADFDDPREFSGGKHKIRYTKRQRNNRRRTKKNKRNKKMTKRKTNKKNK
jgi:hypothetical protein